jgi:23S rRNA (cytosine1962-C5)-methyltransferase
MTSKIYLKKNEERRIKSGHLWVFSNEIEKTEGKAENGDLVEVFDSKNNLLGCGFYNENSLIAVRLISDNNLAGLYSLLKERILKAFELRKVIYPERESYRLVFSESDFLPGLIIDKYNNTFVLQVYSAGMGKNIESIVKILKEDFNAGNIFTKNDSYFRKMERLPEEDKIFLGSIKEEIISDGAIRYKINFKTGQKTGFYFDQNDNRFTIEKFCKGKKVLDAFCNTGGFGLHASLAGASSVTFVDSSAAAIENAKENYTLNNLTAKAEFISDDVFDFLRKCTEENRKFDIAILDPPAFAKNKKSLPTAIKGYEKLNRLAFQCVNENGFLATSSCSHHLSENEFIKAINAAAVKASRKIRLLYFNSASLDHPQLLSMNETGYLKFAIVGTG